MRRAVEHIRAGNGPALVHGHVIRPYSHSLSDDEKLYRPESERKQEAERDPIARFQKFLLAEGILDPPPCRSCTARWMPRCMPPSMPRSSQPFRRIHSYSRYVYSEHLKPTARRFETAPVIRGRRPHHGRSDQHLPAR